MSVSKEVEVEIRRLHFGEHWPVGTVATQVAVHVDVVKRVLGLLEARPTTALRPRAVDAYVGVIDDTLKKYPSLRSTRLHDMLKARGYAGSVRSLREYVATVRPKPQREAYLRVEALMGEQAQIDWAYVGKVPVPGGERPLWLFVMVLSWSRAAWGEFVFDTTVHSLLRSLTRAATYFGGSTRQWLFDNPKTVVLERHGDAARFHPLLLELSGGYCASLRLCAPRKANQKGKVERAIRYWRERFLAGRQVRSIEQGNRELLTFLSEVANIRPHPVQPGRTVAQCFADEKQRLLPLPTSAPATDVVMPVNVDKTAFVRFDTNDYSVPPIHAERRDTLTLCADDVTVRLLLGQDEVARHARNWGRRQLVEDPAHRQALLERKRGAQEAKGQDRLRAAAPGIEALFERWVNAGRNVGALTARTMPLLDIYGEDIFRAAVAEVLAGTTHDHHAVAVVCERLRRKADKPVPLDVLLGSHVRDRDVIPHSLESYDVRHKRRP